LNRTVSDVGSPTACNVLPFGSILVNFIASERAEKAPCRVGRYRKCSQTTPTRRVASRRRLHSDKYFSEVYFLFTEMILYQRNPWSTIAPSLLRKFQVSTSAMPKKNSGPCPRLQNIVIIHKAINSLSLLYRQCAFVSTSFPSGSPL
jgi:hypothetical protein